MRVGTKKVSVTDKAVKEVMSRTTTHDHVGAPAFDLHDPVQRLIYTIGSGFFGENRFYDSLQPKDARGHHTAPATARSHNGKSVVTAENVTNELGLNESAQELVQTMREIAEDDERFEDLLILARWAREDLNLRQTAIMAFVIAARVESEKQRGSGLLRRYAPLILRRADEPKRAFAAYRHLFLEGQDGRRHRTLPKQFARGLIAALQRFNEYQILKYDSQKEAPTFKDLAILLSRYEGRGSKRNGRSGARPFSRAMAKYLLEGKVDSKALPRVAARQELFKRTEWDETAQAFAKAGDVTWENLISHFGSSGETWEWLIQQDQLPYMALLRNLRNLEKFDLSEEAWDKVYGTLTTVTNHRQLPFRFLAARNEVSSPTARSAVDIALDKSVANAPKLGGKTFIMVDASGSMDQAVSGRSQMTCKEVGYAMAAIIAKAIGRKATLGVFAEEFRTVDFSEADSVMRIIQHLHSTGQHIGVATNAYLAVQWLLKTQNKFDRIIVVSDMNCYDSLSYWGYNGASLVELLTRYRSAVNSEAFYYSLNLAGGGQVQMDPKNDHTLILSGWTEKIFSLLQQFEQQPNALPTIQVIRDKYGLPAN